MHLWIAKPCGEIKEDENGHLKHSHGHGQHPECSADDQHRSCADIIVYHIKEHLPAGATARAEVLSAPHESCKSLEDAVRSAVLTEVPNKKINNGCQKLLENLKTALSDSSPSAISQRTESEVCEQVLHLADASALTDLILVLPAESAAAFVKSITNEADVGGSGPSACIYHVHCANRTICLSAKAELPFKFNGSQDWFSANIQNWTSLVLPHLHTRARAGLPVRILELGCWEGRSSCWLIQNVFGALETKLAKDSKLVCVDHFDLMRTDAGRARRAALEHNLLLTGFRDNVHVMESFTVPALLELLRASAEFDFIYIDASHMRSDTLLDAMLTWRLAATGAVVVFDDYQWPNHPRDSPEHPAEGIDAFLSTHRHELEVVRVGYQLFVKRTAQAFRGFEWNDAEEKVLESAVATGGAVWKGRV